MSIGATVFSARAGSILSVDGNDLAVLEAAEENDPDPELLKRTVETSIKIGLDALVAVEL